MFNPTSLAQKLFSAPLTGCCGIIQSQNKEVDHPSVFVRDGISKMVSTLFSGAKQTGEDLLYMVRGDYLKDFTFPDETPALSFRDISAVKTKPVAVETLTAANTAEANTVEEKVQTPKKSRIPRPVKKAPKQSSKIGFLASIPKAHPIKAGTPGAQAMNEYEQHRRVVEFREDNEKPKGQLPPLSDRFMARYNKDLERRKQRLTATEQPATKQPKSKYSEEKLKALATPKHQRQKGEAKPVSEMTTAEFTENYYTTKYLRPLTGKTNLSSQ